MRLKLLIASLCVFLAACQVIQEPVEMPTDSTWAGIPFLLEGDSLAAPVELPPLPAVRPAETDSLRLLLRQLDERLRLLARSDTLIVRIDTARVSAAADSLVSGRVDRLQDEFRSLAPRIFMTILVLVITFFLVRALAWLMEAAASRSARRRLVFKRLIPVLRMLAWSVALYVIVANVFQVDRNGLVAASAALGIGIGLAAQDVLKNILGGIIIIFDQPFQVGDKVSVGGTYGEVISIGLRSTRIVTMEDSLVSVPNAQLVDTQVSSANAGALDLQVVVTMFVPGWCDVEEVKAIAHAAAANSRYIFLDKPIVVLLRDEFRETFLTQVVIKAYVLDHKYESLFASDVTEAAKIGFRDAGILEQMKLWDQEEGP